MQSSLTGHLVFSSLYINDAPSTYTRLIDLGLQEYLINTSLIAVIAQRLVRKLCPKCMETEKNVDALIAAHGLKSIAKGLKAAVLKPKRPVGCSECNHTGYLGRVGIMEYLRCSPEIKALPKDSNFQTQARQYMAQSRIRSLAEDGFLKFLEGTTSLDEVLRVTS
jgi:general secretion pathway protein E